MNERDDGSQLPIKEVASPNGPGDDCVHVMSYVRPW